MTTCTQQIPGHPDLTPGEILLQRSGKVDERGREAFTLWWRAEPRVEVIRGESRTLCGCRGQCGRAVLGDHVRALQGRGYTVRIEMGES